MKRRPKPLFAALAASMAAAFFVPFYFLLEWHPYYLAVLSLTLTTFIMFGADKAAARMGKGRVPEAVLLASGFVGGFIGGLLGMLVFWHKVRKALFWITMAVAVVIHVSIIYRWGQEWAGPSWPFW